MGKPLCDSTATLAVEPPTQLSLPLDSLIPINPTTPVTADSDSDNDDAWGNVSGLEEQQIRNLKRLHSKGVLWKHPEDTKTSNSRSVLFRLRHGGEVSSDGNCLFTSMEKAMAGMNLVAFDGRELRRRAVRKFLEDFENASLAEREAIDVAIRHMYFPDLKCGWGIHVVQEIKLIIKKSEREALDSAIVELVEIGMEREFAAESIYKERCVRVEDCESWAKLGCTDSPFKCRYPHPYRTIDGFTVDSP